MMQSTLGNTGYQVSIAGDGTSVAMLSAATSAQKSASFPVAGKNTTYQASGTTSSGSGAATVIIEGSNVASPSVDGDWVALGQIDLTLSSTKSGGGFVAEAAWAHVRANLSAISGTGASVDVYKGA